MTIAMNAQSMTTQPPITDHSNYRLPHFEPSAPLYIPFALPEKTDESGGGYADRNDSSDSLARSTTLVNDSTSVIDAFLTGDDGKSLLDSVDGQPGVIIARPMSTFSFSRVTSMLSVQGSPSIDSLAPHLNVSGVRMPLVTLCGLIAQCISLERAKIISVECYKEWTKYGVVHRFLVFHLRRSERSDVWLRLDRRAAAGATISKLIRVKGRTAANDTANLAASKAELLYGRRVTIENKLTFDSKLPHLGSFRFFLTVIREELLEYHVWPENCWFLCSILQEHLAEANDGHYSDGSPAHLELARDIRTRIYNRVYHMPQGARVSDVLKSLTITGGAYWKDIYLPKAIISAEVFDSVMFTDRDTVPDSQFIEISDTLRNLSSRSEALQGCHLAARSVALCQRLYPENPTKYAEWLVAALNTYSERLTEIAGAEQRACSASLQITSIYRELYELNPQSRTLQTKLVESVEAYDKLVRKLWDQYSAWTPQTKLVAIYRALYRRDPDKWYNELHDLVDGCVSLVGESTLHTDDACHSLKELANLYCTRFELDPVAYRGPFLRVLEKYVDRLREARNFPELVDYASKLAPIYRDLFKDNPSAGHLSNLSNGLDVLARGLFKMNRPAEACDKLLENAQIYRRLYAQAPNKYREGLIDALSRYVAGLTTAGREKEAEKVRREVDAVDDAAARTEANEMSLISRSPPRSPHSPQRAGKYFPDLDDGDATDEPQNINATFTAEPATKDDGVMSDGASFHTTYEDLSDLVERLRAEYIKSPSATGYDELTRVLKLHADDLLKAGRFKDACKSTLEIVKIDRAQYASYPTEHHNRLASSLEAYSDRLYGVGHAQEACDTLLEAVSVDRRHRERSVVAAATDSRFERIYKCCQRLNKAERQDEALHLVVDALGTLRSPKFNDGTASKWRPKLENLEEHIIAMSGKQHPRHYEDKVNWLDQWAPGLKKLSETIAQPPSFDKPLPAIVDDSKPAAVVNEWGQKIDKLQRSASLGAKAVVARTDSQQQRHFRSNSSTKRQFAWEIDKWKAKKFAEGKTTL